MRRSWLRGDQLGGTILRQLGRGLLVLCVLIAALLGAIFSAVGSAPPQIEEPRNLFGFTEPEAVAAPEGLPALQRFAARDGAQLAYRFYESTADRILIFLHGSSYHGAAYHDVGWQLSQQGVAKVVTPNLRGHFMSGPRRGDVDYIGQLEDDIQDLIDSLRSQGLRGPITIGGHSSGGGLVIRFAGGLHNSSASAYLLLSPLIPTSPSVRGGNAGGWASLHQKRLFGLLALNALGIDGFNGLSIIEFNKPARYWDGTETLSYSYRMNTSYHPRYDYQRDIAAAQSKPLLLVVGEEDEAIDAHALSAMFAPDRPSTVVDVLPGTSHFEVFRTKPALELIAAWMRSQ